LVARHRASLVDRDYFVYEANDEVVLAMLDKQKTYSRARRAGVATPSTCVVRDERDVEPALHEIGVARALKPLHAHRFVHHFGFRQKAFIVWDRAQFDDALLTCASSVSKWCWPRSSPEVTISFSRFITDVDENGSPLFRFVKRKLRQFPPGFGMGCYHVEEWNPIVAEPASSCLPPLVSTLRWSPTSALWGSRLLGYAVLCILFPYQYFVGTTRSQLSCLTGFF
jgi:predicted ATP-grasp superfamily ATP-dependent carboligase